MGKNVTGGNKHKKAKNSTVENKKRLITYADNQDTFYGLVKAPLGGGHMMVHCNDGTDRIGTIRGALFKSNYIVPGDMTLVSLRDFEKVKIGAKERCDIMLKYNPEEVLQLVKRGLYYKDSQRPFMTKLDKGGTKTRDHNGDDDDDDEAVAAAVSKIGSEEEEEEEEEDDDALYMLEKTTQDHPLMVQKDQKAEKEEEEEEEEDEEEEAEEAKEKMEITTTDEDD